MGLGLSGCVATSAPAGGATRPNKTTAAARDGGGESARPWLGISMGKNPGGRPGVLVKQVFRSSPAQAAGLQDGDVLRKIGSKEVNQPGEVSVELLQKSPGDVVEVTFERKGAQQQGQAKLEAFPGGDEVLKRDHLGVAAPPLSGLESVQGSAPLTLSELRGKVVVLDFWASWCVVCRKTVPIINGWHDRLGARGLVVVGLSSDERDEAMAGIRSFGIRYPVAIDRREEVFPAYGASSLPTLYVLDRRGTVRAVEVGFSASNMEEVEQLLLRLLDEPG